MHNNILVLTVVSKALALRAEAGNVTLLAGGISSTGATPDDSMPYLNSTIYRAPALSAGSYVKVQVKWKSFESIIGSDSSGLPINDGNCTVDQC